MKGVKWLTKLTGDENVSRLKTATLGNRILVIFEVWNKTAYLNTQYLLVNSDGTASEPVKLGVKLRFHKSDDVYWSETSNSVVFYAGEKGKLLNRYEVKAAS